MKINIKKSFSLIMSLLIAISCVTFSGISALANDDCNYESLGFIEAISDGAKYLPEDMSQPMTRENFINVISEVFAQDSYGAELHFEDVNFGTESYDLLAKAVLNGWVSDGDEFNPNNNISVDEAVKICCSVAGYDIYCKMHGGYPVGYRQAAQRLKISKDIENSKFVSGYDTLTFIWNTLNAKSMEQSVYTAEGVEFETNGETVMASFFDIYDVEGIMNVNECTSLYDKTYTGDKGYAEIDGNKYKLLDSDLNKYIGHKVRAYYYQPEGSKDRVIKYIYPVDKKSISMNIREYKIDYDSKENTINYTDSSKSNKTLRVKLSKSVIFINNGCVDFDTDVFIPKNGIIELTDNNGDSRYDVASVTHYTYLTVGNVDKLSSKIYDKYDSDKVIDIKKADCGYTLKDTDGNNISIIDIKAGDVVAFAAAPDKRYVSVILCTNKASKELSEIDLKNKTLIFGDTEYELSDELADEYLNYKVGSKYQIAFGVYGEIVDMTLSNSKWIYAYLKKACISKGLNQRLNVSLFTEAGKHVIAESKDGNIIVNGEKISIDLALDAVSEGGDVKPQLIRCLLDEDNTIKSISLAKVVTEIPLTDDRDEEALEQFDFGTETFYSRNSYFYPYFNSAGSVIFKVPEDVNQEKLFDSQYAFPDGNVSVVPYNVSSSGSAGAILYVSSQVTVPKVKTTPLMLIDRVTTVIDDEGNLTRKITGWSDGKFAEYMIDGDLDSSDLESGNVIRYTLNKGIITRYETDFVGKTLSVKPGISSNFNMSTTNTYCYIGGKLYYQSDGYAYLTNTKLSSGVYDTSVGKLINAKLPALNKCVVYDLKTGEVRPADDSSLKSIVVNGDAEAAYILIRSNYLDNLYAIIYLN